MLRFMLSIVGAVTLASFLLHAADPAEIDQLIKQLGSDKYKEREAAAKALDDIGAPAIEALRKASLSGDADVRRKAEELLARIEARAQSDSVLAPTRVKLSYKDLRIGDAVKDFAKRSGYGIELGTEAAALADKPMTLETAALPFWEALERFNEATGLMQQTKPNEPRERERRGRRFGMGPVSDPWVVLVPADGMKLATSLHGALRLRVLPPTETKDDAIRLAVEAALEPRVRWEERPRLTIDKAVDPAGQAVEVQVEEPRGDNDLENLIRQRMPDIRIGRESLFQSTPERIGLAIKGKANASKTLAELRGTLTAKLQGPQQTVVDIDDATQVLNQTIKGKSGYEVKVTKLERHDNGEVELDFEYVGGRPGLGTSLMRVQVVGGGNGPGFPGMARTGPYTLYDADGQPYAERETSESSSFVNGKGTTTVKLTLVPPKAQSTPKRLTFVAPQTATVEIPFAFKNVVLK